MGYALENMRTDVPNAIRVGHLPEEGSYIYKTIQRESFALAFIGGGRRVGDSGAKDSQSRLLETTAFKSEGEWPTSHQPDVANQDGGIFISQRAFTEGVRQPRDTVPPHAEGAFRSSEAIFTARRCRDKQGEEDAS